MFHSQALLILGLVRVIFPCQDLHTVLKVLIPTEEVDCCSCPTDGLNSYGLNPFPNNH